MADAAVDTGSNFLAAIVKEATEITLLEEECFKKFVFLKGVLEEYQQEVDGRKGWKGTQDKLGEMLPTLIKLIGKQSAPSHRAVRVLMVMDQDGFNATNLRNLFITPQRSSEDERQRTHARASQAKAALRNAMFFVRAVIKEKKFDVQSACKAIMLNPQKLKELYQAQAKRIDAWEDEDQEVETLVLQGKDEGLFDVDDPVDDESGQDDEEELNKDMARHSMGGKEKATKPTKPAAAATPAKNPSDK